MTAKYAYKTKEYSPETGLVFFGRRYYNPLIGRFITPDPLGMTDGPNVYLYCSNDPVNLMDIWGLTQKDIDEALGIAKETQPDLNVPDKVYVIPLVGDGSAITNPFNNTVSIDNYYLKPLDEQEKSQLLQVLIHESIHRTKPWYDKILRPIWHNDIYEEAAKRRLEAERKRREKANENKPKANNKTNICN